MRAAKLPSKLAYLLGDLGEVSQFLSLVLPSVRRGPAVPRSKGRGEGCVEMLVTETMAVFAARPWEPRDLGVAQEVGLGADFWTSKVLARPSPG